MTHLVSSLEKVKSSDPKMQSETAALSQAAAVFQSLQSVVKVLQQLSAAGKLSPELKSATLSWEGLLNELGLHMRFKWPVKPLLFERKVLYLDVSTGQIIKNMKFKDLVQELLEYKFCDGQIQSTPS